MIVVSSRPELFREVESACFAAQFMNLPKVRALSYPTLEAAWEEGAMHSILVLDLGHCDVDGPQFGPCLHAWLQANPATVVVSVTSHPDKARNARIAAVVARAAGKSFIRDEAEAGRKCTWTRIIQNHGNVVIVDDVLRDVREAISQKIEGGADKLANSGLIFRMLRLAANCTTLKELAVAYGSRSVSPDTTRHEINSQLMSCAQLSPGCLLVAFRFLLYFEAKEVRGWSPERVALLLNLGSPRDAQRRILNTTGLTLQQVAHIKREQVLAWVVDLCTQTHARPLPSEHALAAPLRDVAPSLLVLDIAKAFDRRFRTAVAAGVTVGMVMPQLMLA